MYRLSPDTEDGRLQETTRLGRGRVRRKVTRPTVDARPDVVAALVDQVPVDVVVPPVGGPVGRRGPPVRHPSLFHTEPLTSSRLFHVSPSRFSEKSIFRS